MKSQSCRGCDKIPYHMVPGLRSIGALVDESNALVANKPTPATEAAAIVGT